MIVVQVGIYVATVFEGFFEWLDDFAFMIQGTVLFREIAGF